MVQKVTTGWVVQIFDDDGHCISQEFQAGEHVDWEDEYGDKIDSSSLAAVSQLMYFPYDMVQPVVCTETESIQTDKENLTVE